MSVEVPGGRCVEGEAPEARPCPHRAPCLSPTWLFLNYIPYTKPETGSKVLIGVL